MHGTTNLKPNTLIYRCFLYCIFKTHPLSFNLYAALSSHLPYLNLSWRKEQEWVLGTFKFVTLSITWSEINSVIYLPSTTSLLLSLCFSNWSFSFRLSYDAQVLNAFRFRNWWNISRAWYVPTFCHALALPQVSCSRYNCTHYNVVQLRHGLVLLVQEDSKWLMVVTLSF
jgi:hypothetical protein